MSTTTTVPIDVVISKLEIMKKVILSDGDSADKYRAIQYNKAIKALVELAKAKNNIVTIADIMELKGKGKGIGEKMITKIVEICESGDLAATKKYIDNPEITAIEELSGIIEIGPQNAKKLVKEHKIMSVEQLRSEGMHLLNDLQKIGLKYYDDMKTKIPRKEMDQHRNYLLKKLSEIDNTSQIEIQGSYRRGKMESGDIDVLIYNADNHSIFKKFVQALVADGYLVDKLSEGTSKYMGFCKLPNGLARRIDIIPTKIRELPFAQLYFTGSGEFNRKLREIVKRDKHVTLNQYNLKWNSGENKGKIVDADFKTEEDILNYLGYTYIPPAEREAENIEKYIL